MLHHLCLGDTASGQRAIKTNSSVELLSNCASIILILKKDSNRPKDAGESDCACLCVSLHIRINWHAIKVMRSLSTLTRFIMLRSDKHSLRGAKTAVSILARHTQIICQNLILRHHECHPVLLLLIELLLAKEARKYTGTHQLWQQDGLW